jgi:uncharacterized flavoprotein (TIGR03862 family)
MASYDGPKKIAIIGGGPAGLMAAESACGQGLEVTLYERKASVGRKFLIAGRGGLNLTHSEPMPDFVRRYRDQSDVVGDWLTEFDNQELCAWSHGLGIETFTGSSGRIFPKDMKAAPLLRNWLKRLRESGVHFVVNHQALGFDETGRLRMHTADGEVAISSDAFIFALGGASWPQLGSDGQWQPWLQSEGLTISHLRPANCGFNYPWTALFKNRFAGAPVKPLCISLDDPSGSAMKGECIISEYGIEGSLVYALSADIRDCIDRHGKCTVLLDLLPDHTLERITLAATRPRNGRSLSDFLRRHFKLSGVKTALLYELAERSQLNDPMALSKLLKALPLTLQSARPIAEAISSAGGVTLAQLDENLMWINRPGVFFAGEMLDWEAPTGGYLLTATMASGRKAGLGAVNFLNRGPCH